MAYSQNGLLGKRAYLHGIINSRFLDAALNRHLSSNCLCVRGGDLRVADTELCKLDLT